MRSEQLQLSVLRCLVLELRSFQAVVFLITAESMWVVSKPMSASSSLVIHVKDREENGIGDERGKGRPRGFVLFALYCIRDRV